MEKVADSLRGQFRFRDHYQNTKEKGCKQTYISKLDFLIKNESSNFSKFEQLTRERGALRGEVATSSRGVNHFPKRRTGQVFI